MKRLFFTVAIIIFYCSKIWAQDYDRDVVKCLYVGIRGQGTDFQSFNKLLEKYGYDPVSNSMACVTFQKTGLNWDKVVLYYGLDVNLSNNTNTNGNYTRYNYFRPNMGIEYPIQIQDNVYLQPHIGLGYTLYYLRLYTTIPDTTLLGNYLSAPNDAKRIYASQVLADIGFNCKMNVFGRSPASLVLGLGYMVPFGLAEWHHDLGKFNSAPAANLGTWYVQLQFGFCRHLHITVKNS